MSRHKPHLTDMRCRAGNLCTACVPSEAVKANLYLCQEHLLLAWSIVQEQIARTGGDQGPFKVVPDDVGKPWKYVRTEENDGYVYYLHVGDRIKIGFSVDPDRRLAQYPPGSRLIAIRIGTKKTERAEHIRYDKHLADGREWFHYSEELEQDILIDGDRGKNYVDEYTDPEYSWERRKADPRTRVEYRKTDVV